MQRVRHYRFAHFLILGLTLWFCAPGLAGAMWPSKIRVTDIKNFTQVLSQVDIGRSDNHRMGPFGFEVVLGPSPPAKHAWIDYSQITTLLLQASSQRIEVSVTLATGSTLKGMLGDTSTTISGNSDLGRTTLRLADLKKIEIIELLASKYDSKPAVLQNVASEGWRTSWLKGGEAWTLTQGSETIEIVDPNIMDSYKTNLDGIMIWFGRYLRVSRESAGFDVERGVSEIEVKLKDWESIEITASSSTAPEAILSKADGTRVAVKMLMWTKKDYDSDQKATRTFGAAEPDDMIIWRTPYGYEGVSLLPERKLKLTKKR